MAAKSSFIQHEFNVLYTLSDLNVSEINFYLGF